jgi:hypothetical protein
MSPEIAITPKAEANRVRLAKRTRMLRAFRPEAMA